MVVDGFHFYFRDENHVSSLDNPRDPTEYKEYKFSDRGIQFYSEDLISHELRIIMDYF